MSANCIKHANCTLFLSLIKKLNFLDKGKILTLRLGGILSSDKSSFYAAR